MRGGEVVQDRSEGGDNAKAAEGLVLALRDGGNKDEAATQAIRYAGLDPLNRKLMVEVQAARLTDPQAHPLSSDELTALEQAVDALKSADGAQALGWNVYKANDVAARKPGSVNRPIGSRMNPPRSVSS